ncbi:MAG: response regulator [Ginsengibacter sp.]
MNKNGPIVVIEDDPDDQEIMTEIFKSLNYKNEIIFFFDGTLALEYLLSSREKPFLILSDINMPKLNGLELREMVHNNEELKLKCIPYLFLTTAASQKIVIDAYSHSVQGFFVKPNSYSGLESTIKKIVEYWQQCEAPNPET